MSALFFMRLKLAKLWGICSARRADRNQNRTLPIIEKADTSFIFKGNGVDFGERAQALTNVFGVCLLARPDAQTGLRGGRCEIGLLLLANKPTCCQFLQITKIGAVEILGINADASRTVFPIENSAKNVVLRVRNAEIAGTLFKKRSAVLIVQECSNHACAMQKREC